jgi:hypothetical protein
MILWNAGIWVDFIETSETNLDEINKYNVLILPFPISLGDDVLEMLSKYVYSGGTLLSEAFPGRYDPLGFAREGGISSQAEKLFSIKHLSVKLSHESRKPPKWTPLERSYGEILPFQHFEGTGSFRGHKVLPNLYVETLKPINSQPIFHQNNKVVGVENNFGNGKAFLIGTLLGHAGPSFNDQGTTAFLQDLLLKSGVKPEICGTLNRRRRVLTDCEAWFLFNMTSKKICEKISMDGFKSSSDLFKNLKSKSDILNLKVNPFEIRCLIMEK